MRLSINEHCLLITKTADRRSIILASGSFGSMSPPALWIVPIENEHGIPLGTWGNYRIHSNVHNLASYALNECLNGRGILTTEIISSPERFLETYRELGRVQV